jgi:ABC-type glycerol-3-phosphate transport system substrate-binding protein
MKIVQILALSAIVAGAGAAQAATSPTASTAPATSTATTTVTTPAADPNAQPDYTKKTIIKWVKRHFGNPSPN